jgi:hypothetical protein
MSKDSIREGHNVIVSEINTYTVQHIQGPNNKYKDTPTFPEKLGYDLMIVLLEPWHTYKANSEFLSKMTSWWLLVDIVLMHFFTRR